MKKKATEELLENQERGRGIPESAELFWRLSEGVFVIFAEAAALTPELTPGQNVLSQCARPKTETRSVHSGRSSFLKRVDIILSATDVSPQPEGGRRDEG